MRYSIDYENKLTFAEPVREHHCELRLVPLEDERQKVLRLEITSEPQSQVRFYVDCYGNRIACLDVIPPHDHLVLRLHAEVETLLANPFSFPSIPPAQERGWIENELSRQPHLLDFLLYRGPQVPEIGKDGFFAEAPVHQGKDRLLESVVEARDWVAKRLEFDPESPAERGPLEDALARGRGDATDLTHALMALVRSWGVPARYVAGFQDVSDEEEERSPVHAWAEVLIPGAGWRGFDVVNGLVVNDAYVAVSVGRDADEIAPLKMAFTGGRAAESPGAVVQFQRQEQ